MVLRQNNRGILQAQELRVKHNKTVNRSMAFSLSLDELGVVWRGFHANYALGQFREIP